jgi:hypothetical protein
VDSSRGRRGILLVTFFVWKGLRAYKFMGLLEYKVLRLGGYGIIGL